MFPLSLSAQSPPRYQFGPDTLRYAERTSARVTMETPGGAAVIQTEHNANVSLAGASGGRVHGWYEQLTLRQQGPGPGEQAPPTAELLRKPYILSVSPAGAVQTQTVPTIPTAIAAMTDLARQFDDFLIKLPSQPLRAGVAWSDTVESKRGSGPDSSTTVRNIRTYRVERDTVVDGARGTVISVRQALRIEATSPLPQQPLKARTVLEGEEQGSAIFIAERGRLHHRERRGTMSGQFTVSGGPQPMALPQRYEYSSTLSLTDGKR